MSIILRNFCKLIIIKIKKQEIKIMVQDIAVENEVMIYVKDYGEFNTLKLLKRFMVHIYDRSFYMVPMQEKISDRIQM